MLLFAKSLLGAVAVLIIALLAKSRSFYVAGLVPLFPTFALIAHALVAQEQGQAALRSTALFGLFALLPYAAYLGTVVWLAERCRLLHTLVAATAVWLLAAALLLWAWSRLQAA